MQLVNYFSIIQLDGCLYSFCCHGVFVMKMKFSVNLDNNKVVDKFLICLFLKFYGCRPDGLRAIAFRSLLSGLLVLWTDLKD
jgi:hypothetical protein